MRIRNILLMAGTVLLLAGCKPTEKGYQAAYDAAKAKREYKDPDQELLTGGHKLLNDDASNWKVIGNDSLQIQHVRISPEDGKAWPQSGPYRLAVAMFKMNTNALSMLKDLDGKGGLTPIAATDGRGRHFIIAGSATYPDSLGMVLDTFRKANPGFRYIGMEPEQAQLLCRGRGILNVEF